QKFYTRIPNILTGIFILAGLGLQFWTFGVPGVTTGFLGGLTGLALLLIPFLMGGMGAGDVKALAALGTVTGPAGIFQVFLYMGVFGGVMAIIHYIAAGKLQERLASFWSAILVFAGTKDKDSFNPVATGEKLRFPYAAAIALGYFTYIQMGTVWG
ncbi:MAG: hypothetical protein GX751_05685, partial [Desulfuromonadaceae bacterium]|nr:hypothetical protein [Desulfuromonadaceae bacterium]